MPRPLCICGFRPAAINYKKNGRTYYRKMCEKCLSGGLSRGIPKWYQSGYRITNQCELCGFKSKHKEQFNVYHSDGNLNNCRPLNLKTICANCQRIVDKTNSTWQRGGLLPDL